MNSRNSESADSVNFVLPFEQLDKYSLLFEELEKNEEVQFKVQLTNLEEAFLNFSKLQEGSALSDDIPQNKFRESAVANETIEYSQFKSVLLKRWYTFKKDWRMWTLLILPSLIALAFILYGLHQTKKSGSNFFDLKNVTVPSNSTMPLSPNQIKAQQNNVTSFFNATLQNSSRFIPPVIDNLTIVNGE